MSEYLKPLPVPNEDSVPFWEAAKRHELSLQQCKACSAFRFPPAPLCPECNVMGGDWTRVKGKGKIYSFVVFHRAYHKGFEGQIPYAVALVELDEGPRVMGNVLGVPPDQLKCDMRVEAIYEDVTPGVTLPQFRLA